MGVGRAWDGPHFLTGSQPLADGQVQCGTRYGTSRSFRLCDGLALSRLMRWHLANATRRMAQSRLTTGF